MRDKRHTEFQVKLIYKRFTRLSVLQFTDFLSLFLSQPHKNSANTFSHQHKDNFREINSDYLQYDWVLVVN